MPGSRRAGLASRREADLDALEHLLQSSLHQVEPRQSFRSGLHTRLSKTPVPRRSPGVILQYVVISLGGVAVAALLVVAARRVLSALLGSVGLLSQMRPSLPAEN